jgi:acetyl-CoA carboxylase biotin carboxyl carrier protein
LSAAIFACASPASCRPSGYAVETPAPLGASDLKAHPGVVNSPMVGTAYLKPNPESENFVKVGETVKKGDTILLIEAMKTFNPIVAEKSGTISEILVEEGQPVEYGEPLFILI